MIRRLSTLRPYAYIIVFTDNPKVRGAVAINFGVYCYPLSERASPQEFVNKKAKNYGFSPTQPIRILDLEVSGEKIVASRFTELN